MLSSKKSIYLSLLSVSFLWGTSFAAAKIGLRELEPLNLVLMRSLIASGIYICILMGIRGKVSLDRADISKFLLLGFLAITSYFYIQFTGLKFTTTINAALIIATSPVSTALFGLALGVEKTTLVHMVGIITAFGGVALITTQGSWSGLFQSATLPGDLLLLLNACVWAGITLYGRTLMRKYSPFIAMAFIHIAGTMLLLPFLLWQGPFAGQSLAGQWPSLTTPTFIAVVHLAALCSVYAYYVWYNSIQAIGAVKTSVFLYLNPLFAMIVGIWLMGETLTAFTLSGGAMVIAGVYLTNRSR